MPFLERESCVRHGVTLVYTSSVRQAFFSWFNFSISYFYSLLVHVDYVNYHVVIFIAHLPLNELSLICDMWLNKISYLLTYLLTCSLR